jgi:hypothetical protein
LLLTASGIKNKYIKLGREISPILPYHRHGPPPSLAVAVVMKVCRNFFGRYSNLNAEED